MQVVEAYKFKVPVITSNVSSLPEIAGKGAILVNPQKEDEIEKAIVEIYYNKDLRKILIVNQKKELKKYNYIETGKKILLIYKESLFNFL